MSTALLIIDVQRALCNGDDECFDIQRVIGTINELSTKARTANIPVILIQHEEEGNLLEYGGEGWQLAEGLKTSPQDLRVRKTNPDSFYQTRLHEHLQELEADRLIICGLQTDYCINTTVRQAHQLGYDVVLVADAHSTISNGAMSAEDIIAEHNKDLAHLTGSVARIDVMPAREIKL